MPNAIIKSFAKKAGKSTREVEKLWDKAKSAAYSAGKKPDDPSFFAYVTGTLKNMLDIKENKLIRFKDYIIEEDDREEYGILLVRLDQLVKDKILEFALRIPQEELYVAEDEGYGIEYDTHITLRYGTKITDPSKLDDISTFLPITGKLSTTSFFSLPEYDVLKIGVSSKSLEIANKAAGEMISFPGETFPEYKPHCTMAYLKKGFIGKYINDSIFEDVKFDINEIYFIDHMDNEYVISY